MRKNYGHIRRETVTNFLGKYIIFSASHRRKLSIHAVSQTIDPSYTGNLASFGTLIPDLLQWRLP
ncbi:hypothetical protein DSO57_1029960 [Entomophthora muscae]|uniref:Uncharacterized protein n=1 Tax=Entomophthora muscae TaxID=34485 RepID=A0ACC2TCG2_9FUNG|nr:hypothetical protein DSO57_1029960 [Entomophthora muscae]